MDASKMGQLAQQGYTLLIALGTKVLEALALWFVGRWLIGFTVRLISRVMTRQKIDPTLVRYINNTVAAVLNILLVVAILGFFGVQTTSIAAAAGVAIGMAWSGLLSNFAAGVFCNPSKWGTSWWPAESLRLKSMALIRLLGLLVMVRC